MDQQRRKFIKKTAAGLIAVPTLASSTPGIAAGNEPIDTIVIGGGFAGVTAGRELSARGLNTLVLEAQPRLGGRVLTIPLAGHDIDLGGTWVGWSQPHVWTEIMRYGLDIDESAAATAETAIWFDNGKRIVGAAETYAEIFERSAAEFYGPARVAFPRPFDPLYAKGFSHLDAMNPVEAINKLNLMQVEKDMALSLAGINAHAPPAQSSYLDQLRWFALGDFDVWNMWDNLGRYRVRGGTEKLLQKMRDDCDAKFLLDSIVKSIVSTEGKVAVTTNAGTVYHARTAVVAVPLNCLADIDFQPSLGAVKSRVSKTRHTGSGTKIYARVKNVKAPVMCQGTVDMPLNFLWTEYVDEDSQILVGFGTSDTLLNINSEEAVQSAIRIFLPKAELLEFFTYDWNADPYSKGTWCMYRPNVLTEDFEELQANQGNIYFSGADIARGWRGFIDGAIESGLRVGRQVAERLKSA